MNAEVRRRLDDLLQALRSSEECRQFTEARARLNEEPKKRRKTDEFRRRNFLYQNSEEHDLEQEQVEMYREREKLRRDPVIDDYLNAELVFCRMLRQIGLEIMNAEDLDLSSMEDIL